MYIFDLFIFLIIFVVICFVIVLFFDFGNILFIFKLKVGIFLCIEFIFKGLSVGYILIVLFKN